MKKNKHTLIKFLKYSFKAHKLYFLVLFFQILIRSAMTLFGAYTLSILIFFLEKGNYKEALLSVVVLVSIEVGLTFLNTYIKRLVEVHNQKMILAIKQMLSNKIMSLPFQYLEDPYYLELKKNAEMGIDNMGALSSLMTNIASIISSFISIIGLVSIIVSFDAFLVLILVAGILLNILMIFISMKYQVQFYKSLLPINFKYGYYLNTMINTTNCKDFRLYSLGDLLCEKFNHFSKEVASNVAKAQIIAGFHASIISTIQYVEMAGIYILVGIRTITKQLPIASFSLTISAAVSFSDAISTIISASGNYKRSIEYIKPAIELMALPEDIHLGKEALNSIEEICFENVSFKYPNTDTYVLKNVSFLIKEQEKISIVGLNGAGKTTIVKLLCRLYSVTEGVIKINGIPIEQYDKESYIKEISALFQDYKLFSYSIQDNISPSKDLSQIQSLCEEVGIREAIEALPNQYASCLSKSYEEEGVDMSGGQKQKIAIARSLAKDASLLILDEPTSALDPLAEAEIYENFNDMVSNKMAIYISHRMSSSIFCDKILVLDGGSVTDFDSHKNLMKRTDSLYYQLFSTQAKNYKLTGKME
ncbi:MAG: ABC transporter ATP-binding protein/permease [Anaeroplasmataceae bacterium]|nr:ABC transporter ATP-binding protein/permease [Anaeroplasmataceae bacterium]